MQKSLFKKLFVMSLCIVTSAMVIMGAILFVFFRNFWINEKQSLLRSQSLTVEMQLDRMYGVMNYEHQARRMLAAMSDSTGGTMLITDSSGKILSASDASLIGLTIPSYAVETAKSGEYSELGTLGSVLPDDSYVLGKQLEAKSLEDDYIFTCLPASGLRYYLGQIMQLFLISAIIVCIMVFCAVYAVSARLVRPIREMAQAARSMSRGDFTRYIRVDRQDEIGELAIAFNNMTRSLSAGEQMRRGFVANVSHELKTPMTTIAGFIDGILDGTIDEKDRDRYLRIVSNEVRRLSRLVVAMLSLSKLESGEMKLSPIRVDLTQLTVDIALGFEQRINEKNIDIRGLEDLGECPVTADRDLMHQVIYNLIDNAIKYTPSGGYILFGSKKHDGKQYMSIRNSGDGIPKKELNHIFDRFYKVDKSRTDKGGAGLGLFLVKTILSLHDGAITVNSVENEYTEFIYSLTAAESADKTNTLTGGPNQDE